MKDKPSRDSDRLLPRFSTSRKPQDTPPLRSPVFSEEVKKMAKKPRSKAPAVVPGLEPRESVAVPAAGQSVQIRSSRKCHVHPNRNAPVEISIGPVSVWVCNQCGSGLHHAMGAFTFLKSFL